MKPLSSPRAAIVGCGRMGLDRARAVLAARGEVDQVYDVDPDRSARLAAEIGGARVVRSTSALDWDAVDALFICTPPSARGGLQVEAITRGIPLFVEKPVALAAAQCAPVLDALSQRPTITAVGYMNRYRPSVRAARATLATSAPLGAIAHWVGKRYRVAWWADAAHSGGPFNEQATHLVDLARYLLGDVTEVVAAGNAERASVALQHESGALTSLLYSCAATTKMIAFEAFNAASRIRLEGWDFAAADSATPTNKDKAAIFRLEVAAFLDAVRQRDPSPVACDYVDAVRTQCTVDAVAEALRSRAATRVATVEA